MENGWLFFLVCGILAYGLLVNWKSITSYFGKYRKPKKSKSTAKPFVGFGGSGSLGIIAGMRAMETVDKSFRELREAENKIRDYQKQEIKNPFEDVQ
tara:strand:- start:13536 stop:13826 length:291 start_codon:yes stop_codon:yes gene_type:complete